jgi:hypothetical protein
MDYAGEDDGGRWTLSQIREMRSVSHLHAACAAVLLQKNAVTVGGGEMGYAIESDGMRRVTDHIGETAIHPGYKFRSCYTNTS